jgi:hypothetical protein
MRFFPDELDGQQAIVLCRERALFSPAAFSEGFHLLRVRVFIALVTAFEKLN